MVSKWLILLLSLVLTCCISVPCAHADDGTASTTEPTASENASTEVDTMQDVSGNILDTQNLLGNDLTQVTDAIQQTYEETGVTVRLVYVTSFNTQDSPDVWAESTLRSLDPKPNTVMLAVASNDGNLAVVVSPNSDEWLRNQSTVDDLSEAASAPLVQSGDQSVNWAKSAIDMMDAIKTAKRTSTSGSVASIGVIVLVSVLGVLIVGVIVLIIVRRRKEVQSDVEGVETSSNDSSDDTADDEITTTSALRDTTVTKDDAVQDNNTITTVITDFSGEEESKA